MVGLFTLAHQIQQSASSAVIIQGVMVWEDGINKKIKGAF